MMTKGTGLTLADEDATAEPQLPHLEYRSTQYRTPHQPLIRIPAGPTETCGPALSLSGAAQTYDLTAQHSAAPIGQRIIVAGRVLDDRGRAIPNALVEIWQANAAGRYAHQGDSWDAPLDPNFTGAGLVQTDRDGNYRFITVMPGAYPWGNHDNAWRPAHIHFAVLGPAIGTRLITQMYFPGDPLVDLDPIVNAIPLTSRQRMVARLDLATTEPAWALAYQFDIILRGQEQTPMEHNH